MPPITSRPLTGREVSFIREYLEERLADCDEIRERLSKISVAGAESYLAGQIAHFRAMSRCINYLINSLPNGARDAELD
jgi:hypothetical protein